MKKGSRKKTYPESGRRQITNRKSSISKAGTYAAMADFWDEHDLSEYWDKTRSVGVNVELESEESLYAIEKGLSQTLRRAAKAGEI
ncbi:MAG: hypothetical protein A2Z25_18975 [Planctomycetes bacterium RBG_16_55_9]|nr:MAG: hypothetical protein A2Z25_18975 [Planctomycetes bacterium RBG_16_55_9]